jgi:hypothetical protein
MFFHECSHLLFRGDEVEQNTSAPLKRVENVVEMRLWNMKHSSNINLLSQCTFIELAIEAN